MPLGGMFADSSSLVSDGHVFARTWHDCMPQQFPDEREVSRSFGLKREGQIQERSLSGHHRTWIALPRLAAKWVETVILLQVICLTIATSIIAIWWNWSL